MTAPRTALDSFTDGAGVVLSVIAVIGFFLIVLFVVAWAGSKAVSAIDCMSDPETPRCLKLEQVALKRRAETGFFP